MSGIHVLVFQGREVVVGLRLGVIAHHIDLVAGVAHGSSHVLAVGTDDGAHLHHEELGRQVVALGAELHRGLVLSVVDEGGGTDALVAEDDNIASVGTEAAEGLLTGAVVHGHLGQVLQGDHLACLQVPHHALRVGTHHVHGVVLTEAHGPLAVRRHAVHVA